VLPVLGGADLIEIYIKDLMYFLEEMINSIIYD